MKELAGTARNLYLSVSETEEKGNIYRPSVEMVLCVSEPIFKLTADDVIRERSSETIRFVTNRKGVKGLIKSLMEIDSDLEKIETEMKTLEKGADG